MIGRFPIWVAASIGVSFHEALRSTRSGFASSSSSARARLPWALPTSSSMTGGLAGASGTVEEGDHCRRQRRLQVDVVVGRARQDRKPVLCLARAVPAGIALASAKEIEELDRVRRRQAVGG